MRGRGTNSRMLRGFARLLAVALAKACIRAKVPQGCNRTPALNSERHEGVVALERGSVRVSLFEFLSASIGLEFVPVAGGDDRSQVEHGFGSDERPPHAAPFHAILHQVPTRAFDHARRDRVTGRQVNVVTQAREMGGQMIKPKVKPKGQA